MESLNHENIGRRIREIRTSKGMTQQDLGKAMRALQSSVSLWERGQQMPDVLVLAQLAEILGTTLDYLVNGRTVERCIDDTPLSQEEQDLLRCFAAADEESRRALLVLARHACHHP